MNAHPQLPKFLREQIEHEQGRHSLLVIYRVFDCIQAMVQKANATETRLTAKKLESRAVSRKSSGNQITSPNYLQTSIYVGRDQ
jgi:hypothetical protein